MVNGAQTVSTIGRYNADNTNISKIKIPIRLISLEGSDNNFGQEVTKANNRQNRIENRDFVSQDQEQIRIRGELSIEGVDYNIVRSDSYKSSDTSFDLIEATIALACASNDISLAVQAKREIGKFFENLTRAPYRKIFNPQVNGVYVMNTVNVMRAIDNELNKHIELLDKKSGKNYGVLVHGNRVISLLVMNDLGVHSSANAYEFQIEREKLNSSVEKHINKIHVFLAQRYSDKVLGTLFKNGSICKEMYNYCV